MWNSLDLLVAFVTDQHPRSAKSFLKDTIYTGKLIKLLYENNIGRFANKVKKVELKVIRQAPVDLMDCAISHLARKH